MKLPHISRMISRLILPLAFPVLFVHGSWRNLKRAGPHLASFGVNFSILPRILIVAVISASFLVFFNDQNQSRSNRIGALETAVRTAPSDFNKRLQLALLYEDGFKKNNDRQFLEKALEEAQVARQLNGQSISVIKLLARLNAANSAEIKKEIQDVEAIIKARPDYAAAWLKLATLYEKLGDDVSASDAKNKARLLNGNF